VAKRFGKGSKEREVSIGPDAARYTPPAPPHARDGVTALFTNRKPRREADFRPRLVHGERLLGQDSNL
jgi:hypothetical protein